MIRMKKLMLAGALLGAAVSAQAESQSMPRAECEQQVTLRAGWNAFYLTVTPNASADDLFADWPVESVSYYNPASYLETKQYSGASSTEGVRSSSLRVWRRGEPALSSLKSVTGNGIYICYSTNSTFSSTLVGSPVAPRLTWHPSSTNETQNYVGISLKPGTTTTLDKYFSGCNAGMSSYLTLNGASSNNVGVAIVSTKTPLTDGQVLAISTSRMSDWSGVLHVSPQNGINFSTNLSFNAFSVRNDGATNRTVSVLLRSAKDGTLIPPTGLVKYRDASVSTNDWADLVLGTPLEKNLAAGETLTLQLALDRTKFNANQSCAALLVVDDTDGGSNMQVKVPLTAAQGESFANVWPQGLWMGTAKLNTVDFYNNAGTPVPTAAGGAVEVRLPLYVDKDGKMTLLQRVIMGVSTNGASHIYSARVENAYPAQIGNVKRVSSAVLPIGEPVIAATNGTFGTQADFGFTVSETSNVNPMRHARHPSHDGLKWDFKTPTPSGDEFGNYISTVKPETFSITNRISFVWEGTTGTAWTPDETLKGNLEWALEGVRHEGAIRMRGPFSMTRISDATLDE